MNVRMSRKLIERRRSQRRSEPRRSTSFNVSKVLDDGSDVFDTPSPLWYKNLQNVTPTNNIPRLSYGLNDDTILSPMTTVFPSNAPEGWWKHLNTTNTPHLPSTSQEKSQRQRQGEIEVSSDTSESENMRQKKKRVVLRPKKPKGRRSTNVFDDLVNESESAIASEPTPVTKNKSKDDISPFQSYDEASLKLYQTEMKKKLNQTHEENPKERRGFGKNPKRKVAVRMFDEVLNSQSMDNIEDDNIEIGSFTKSRSSQNHEQSEKIDKSATNLATSFGSKKEIVTSIRKNKIQESTTSDSEVEVRKVQKKRPKFSRKPRESLGANVFDEIPAEESIQPHVTSNLEKEGERNSSPRKSPQAVESKSPKTRKSLSKEIQYNKSSGLKSDTSESSLDVTSDKGRRMRPNFQKRKSMLQKVHMLDEILAEESHDSKRLKTDFNTSSRQTGNKIPVDGNSSTSQIREISSPNLEMVVPESQETRTSPDKLEKSRRSFSKTERSPRTLRLQEDFGNTTRVSPNSPLRNQSRTKDSRIEKSPEEIPKSNVTPEAIGKRSRILQVEESFSKVGEETKEQPRKVPPPSPKARRSLRPIESEVAPENKSESSGISEEISLQGQLSLEKSALDQHLFTSTPLLKSKRIVKTLSSGVLEKENSRKSTNLSQKNSRIVEPTSKSRISKHHDIEVSESNRDESSFQTGRKKVPEKEKSKPLSFQESAKHSQETIQNSEFDRVDEDLVPNPGKSISRNKIPEEKELMFRKKQRNFVESSDEEELESDLDPAGVDEGPETISRKPGSRSKSPEKEELMFRKNRRTFDKSSDEEEVGPDPDPAGVDEGPEKSPRKSRSRNKSREKEEVFSKKQRSFIESFDEGERESDLNPAGVNEGPETISRKSVSRSKSPEKEELVFRKNRRTFDESSDEEELGPDPDSAGVDKGPEKSPRKSGSRNKSREKEEIVLRKSPAGGRLSKASIPVPERVSGADKDLEKEGGTFTNASVPVQRKLRNESGKDLSRSRKQLPRQQWGFASDSAQKKISTYFKPISEADKEKWRQAVEKVEKSRNEFFQKMAPEEKKRLETVPSREEAEQQRHEQLKLALKKKMEQLKKSDQKKKKLEKSIPAAYIVNGNIYRPRKLPRPARYCTDRLYQFLMKRLEPKYGTMNKVRAEKFVVQLVEVMKIIDRRRKYESYRRELRVLKKEMARLGIIRTDNDFFNFAHDFLPQQLQDKVVPILLPGNATTIPYFPDRLNAPILEEEEEEEREDNFL